MVKFNSCEIIQDYSMSMNYLQTYQYLRSSRAHEAFLILQSGTNTPAKAQRNFSKQYQISASYNQVIYKSSQTLQKNIKYILHTTIHVPTKQAPNEAKEVFIQNEL